jgi:hypothetical protein
MEGHTHIYIYIYGRAHININTHLHRHMGLHGPACVGLDGDVAALGRLQHAPLRQPDGAKAVQPLWCLVIDEMVVDVI